MRVDAATGRSRHVLAMAAVVATGVACASWMTAPLAAVPSVLLQGLPAWLR